MKGNNQGGFKNEEQLKVLEEVETELQKQKQDPKNFQGFSIM